MKNRCREIALVIVPAKGYGCRSRYLCEIPQIDISMLMPDYPGQYSHLAGIRICVEANKEKHSGHAHIDLLFRVSCLTQFHEVHALLRSIKLRQESYQRWILSNPYPIETILEDQRDNSFSAGFHRSAVELTETEKEGPADAATSCQAHNNEPHKNITG